MLLKLLLCFQLLTALITDKLLIQSLSFEKDPPLKIELFIKSFWGFILTTIPTVDFVMSVLKILDKLRFEFEILLIDVCPNRVVMSWLVLILLLLLLSWFILDL